MAEFVPCTILSLIKFWPSRETDKRLMPQEFLATKAYASTRVIIDATELFIEKPSDLSLQGVTWSNYKSHNTLKGMSYFITMFII